MRAVKLGKQSSNRPLVSRMKSTNRWRRSPESSPSSTRLKPACTMTLRSAVTRMGVYSSRSTTQKFFVAVSVICFTDCVCAEQCQLIILRDLSGHPRFVRQRKFRLLVNNAADFFNDAVITEPLLNCPFNVRPGPGCIIIKPNCIKAMDVVFRYMSKHGGQTLVHLFCE